MTHNTGECHEYEKDGTLKKGFSGKATIEQKRNDYNKKKIPIPMCSLWTAS